MSTEVLTIQPIYATPEQGITRAVLNNGHLEKTVAQGFSLKEIIDNVSNNPALLEHLSRSLDFSGINELSFGQRQVYGAITDMDNLEKTMPEIAYELNLREGNFGRLRGKVYGHLGVRSREQAYILRQAYERKTSLDEPA